MKLSVISEILISAYIALLDSRVSNIDQPDVWLGITFFVFLVLSMCVLYILKKVQVANILLPMLCCFVLFETRTVGRTFKDMPYISIRGLSISDCISIDLDMVSQFVRTDQEGLKEMTLYVPDFKTVQNWPLGDWGGNDMSRTLYRHGLIDYPITVKEMVPSQDKNDQFNLH